MTRPRHLFSLPLLAVALLATSGHAQPSTFRTFPAVADSVQLLGTDLQADSEAARADEPEVASPFAVSSSGRVVPRERREVTVIGADPTIAEALARRDRTPASRPEPERSSPSTRSPRGIVHRVERGETLRAIARRYDVSPESIREANDLGDERVRPDQMLVIPVADGRQSTVDSRQ